MVAGSAYSCTWAGKRQVGWGDEARMNLPRARWGQSAHSAAVVGRTIASASTQSPLLGVGGLHARA